MARLVYRPDFSPKSCPATRLQRRISVSDGSVPAATIDPNLINPWGLSFSPTSPYWVADNGTGVTTLYNAAGAQTQTIAGQTAITIAAPPGQTTPSAPTGTVFNFASTGFNVTSGGKTGSSVFLFATEDGTISGWNPTVDPASSVIAVNNSAAGAVYKGLAIGQTQGQTLLYAANFSQSAVDVFNSNFQQVGSFTDPNVPAGFAPFNVQVLGGNLFVTFALQDAAKHDDVAGAGNGYVDEFSLNGQLMQRIASNGPLDLPWGLAIAPPSFGPFANDLLVGNFGDGTISIYHPNTFTTSNNSNNSNNFNNSNTSTTTTAFTYIGKLGTPNGQEIQIPDLWSLQPGNNSPGSNPSDIYFTAGLQNEAHGLFGTLAAVAPQARLPASDPPPASAAQTDSAKLTALLMGMNHQA